MDICVHVDKDIYYSNNYYCHYVKVLFPNIHTDNHVIRCPIEHCGMLTESLALLSFNN